MMLYLLPSEQALYNKLPATLKKAWGGEVADETGTGWETDSERAKRAALVSAEASLKDRSDVREFLAK